jgi:trk system potassium uptake protein TrkH
MHLMGLDFETAFSSVLACISNIGPGLAGVGAVENYAHIPTAGKILLTFCMLLGRLEFYSVLILLLPLAWKR